MAKLGDAPFIHENVEITDSTFGRFVEIGAGSRVQFTEVGDYSYCDRYPDIARRSAAIHSAPGTAAA